MSGRNLYTKWAKCCRLCYSDNKNIMPIFQDNPLIKISLHIKIEECTFIKVQYGDGLPSNICTDCHAHINNWYTYKEECKKVDMFLRQQLLLLQLEEQKQILQREQEKEQLIMNMFPVSNFVFPVYSFIDTSQIATTATFELKNPTQECTEAAANQRQVYGDDNIKFISNNVPHEFKYTDNITLKNVYNNNNRETHNNYLFQTDSVKTMYNGNIYNNTCGQVNNNNTPFVEDTNCYQKNMLTSVCTDFIQGDSSGVPNGDNCGVSEHHNIKFEEVVCDTAAAVDKDIQKEIPFVHIDGRHNQVNNNYENICTEVNENHQSSKFVQDSTSSLQNITCHQNMSVHTDVTLIENNTLKEKTINDKMLETPQCSNLNTSYDIHTAPDIDKNENLLSTNGPDFIDITVGADSENDSNTFNINDVSSDLLTKVLQSHCKTKMVTTCSNDSDEENNTCNHCNKDFIGKLNFEQHICTHSGGMSSSCLLCEVNTPIKEDTSNEACQNVTVSGERESVIIAKKQVSQKQNLVNCSLCNKSFYSEASFKLHSKQCRYTKKNSLWQDDPAQCSLCNKWFSSKLRLIGHIKRYCAKEKELVPCRLCTKVFATKYCLDKHVSRTHRREKTSSCDQCPAKFKNNQVLKVHRLSHSSERLYLCSFCGDSFKSDPCLKSHINYNHNTSKKIYECDVCKKVCKTRTDMIKHFESHTLRKSYFCQTCNQSFKSKHYLLYSHLCDRSNLETVSCIVCHKVYNKIYIKQHMRYHTQSIVCLVCGLPFGNSAQLRRHMKTKKHKRTEVLNDKTTYKEK